MKPMFAPSINWLFVFVPLSLLLERAHVPPPLLFFSAALAVVPIARLIVLSTEQLALRTGDAIGGLLNATFGNAPELIIALVALRAGFFDMVRASIIGAILANLMLAMGIAFFVGGLRYHTQEYNAGAARLYSSMMLMSAISLGVPSAFNRFFSPAGTLHEEKLVNLGTAFVLLAAYALYLVFLLRTHPDFFQSAAGTAAEHEDAHEQWTVARAVGSLVGASALAAWMSEILVGAAEGTGQALGMSDVFIGIVLLAAIGGAAESGSAIAMARKNKLDLTVGIAMGSSIQIALFVAPMLVLASGFIAAQPLELSFSRAEIGTLFLGVLVGTIVAGDGHSNWYKGVQLILVYAMIAILFYFLPEAVP
ncbi:MAG TPA: calcium/proton exchanger [Vicinamibacterales bacterium]|nr:calcium/proton exchanger [Vicinamibacterales bacterium]